MVRKLLGVMLLVFAAGMAFGMKDGRTGREKVIRMSMIHGCEDGAAKGLPEGKSTAFCECTIDKLIKDHGYKKLDRSITADPAQQPAWLVRDMRGNAQQCAADMGVEITFENP
jgi:hypothetical protein